PQEGFLVKGLFPRPVFTNFGPCALAAAEIPCHAVSGDRPARLRVKVRQECPGRPGVYGMLNQNGQLVYVGKAKSLRARLLSYFRVKSGDPKAARIIRDARQIVWEPVASEFAALLRELELIRRFEPYHNVHGQPKRRRRVYLCLGRQPAYVFATRKPPAD